MHPLSLNIRIIDFLQITVQALQKHFTNNSRKVINKSDIADLLGETFKKQNLQYEKQPSHIMPKTSGYKSNNSEDNKKKI